MIKVKRKLEIGLAVKNTLENNSLLYFKFC
jgi:hypothetical protein